MRGRAAGVGVLAGGVAALVAALVLSTATATWLPVWVQVVVIVLVVLGIGIVITPKWLARRERLWLAGLLVGAAVLGVWALFAGIADVRFGLPGPAIPVLAVGCVAVVVATVPLVGAPPGLVARQAFPAAAGALVAIGLLAGSTVVVAQRITVDATTADRVDPAAVPDPSAGVGWTSTWRRAELETVRVVAAGAGVVVISGDRVVAIDGSTGVERWHYRRAGASAVRLTASPDRRTVVATFTAGDDDDPTNSVFAFDANTGDVRWGRWPVNLWGVASHGGLATDHAFVTTEPDGTLVGVDLGSGAEVWRWAPPSDCAANGNYVTSPDAVLVPVLCGDPAAGGSYSVIGFDDREGTQRWRSAVPTVAGRYGPESAELTTSSDGRATLYQTEVGGPAPMLLDSATGAVLHRTGDDERVIEPDRHTPVLRREVPGERPQLVVRDLRTEVETPLASSCPAVQDQTGDLDELNKRVRVVVAAASVVVLCSEAIGVYSRTDGARTASLSAAVDGLDELPTETELLPAAGAIVLVLPREVMTTVLGLT